MVVWLSTILQDNQLIDMLNLFEDGYKCRKKSEADRSNFGLKLRQALEEFTRTFLPHMAEEEQVGKLFKILFCHSKLILKFVYSKDVCKFLEFEI